MRSSADFDRFLGRDYGAATSAIRRAIAEWATVNWFAGPVGSTAELAATELLLQHNRCGASHAPDRFSADSGVAIVRGGWREFAALCAQVRSPNSPWDWKFGSLKKLIFEHSKAQGWRIQDQKRYSVDASEVHDNNSGALLVRFGDHVFWAFAPSLDTGAAFRESPHLSSDDEAASIEVAAWYMSYAHMDLIHCIQWQLAADDFDLDDNPFFPLVQIYAKGLLPFGLSQTQTVLFAFEGTLASSVFP